ncbi:mediator of RNA polymerase II transcription subunit 29 isoform X1 [Trachemys scripta elegans]|uniref:mediator of RNA polymerase II transcription subunit 29 isoform X1 n=1 Tax=Trachemys scripta elegans TaxID=31138 RepID=UPI0015577FD0|nr:mediator of RNA polymerase II transcription subunit 29 isoform X1 [Trachemys scripta elegans]
MPFKAFHSPTWSTESNASLRLTYTMCRGFLNSHCTSDNKRRVKIVSNVDLFPVKPDCLGRRFRCSRGSKHASRMCTRAFPGTDSKNLMKIAAQNLIQNTNIDNGQKSNDGLVQRFDKSLEEFYALCDQLELCLRLAYECLSQSFDSTKHSPNLVPTATKPDAVQTESLPYTQYLSMIKSQISCAKDIHNALLECSNKITGKIPAQGGP